MMKKKQHPFETPTLQIINLKHDLVITDSCASDCYDRGCPDDCCTTFSVCTFDAH